MVDMLNEGSIDRGFGGGQGFGVRKRNQDNLFPRISQELGCERWASSSIDRALVRNPHDEGIPITAEKIATLVKAANVPVEPYWPGLFTKLAKKKN
ncbi:hypothetical protein C1H46_040129 [Malus baccata]|uniref:Uncharacterized protein n=1 Tax=Malus baccata TaxID=106549 RepID=A0A540KJF5_MALBA|nr:hypothetical protein C1H46_040129 [Malus baccata]